MLLLGSKGITVEGIQVFMDHADPNQYWYLPGPVALARRAPDRWADFTFIKFKPAAVAGGAKGGGFLMFVVDLQLDQSLERRILGKVSALATGEAKLSAVQFDEGTVRCVALNLQGPGGTTATVSAQGTFQAVQQILGASVPSLFGDNAAAFSLTLSQEGATILEQSFKEGTTPVGVIYELKFTGMRPALDVKITADFKRIYEQFSAGLDVKVYYVQAGIEVGFEKLVQSGAITIEVTNYTGAADLDQKEKWALDFFKEKLLAEWFEPTLMPGQLAGGGAAALGGGNAMRPPTTPPPARSATLPPLSGTPGGGGVASPGGGGVASPGGGGTASPGGAASPGGGAAAPSGSPPPGGGALREDSVSPAAGSGRGSPPAANPLRPAAPVLPGASPVGPTGSPPAPAGRPSAAGSGLGFNPAAATNATQPLGNMSGSGASPFQVALKLKYIKQDELKTMTFEYHRSEATQRTYAPQGFFGLLASDLDMTLGGRHFVEVDLDDPFFRVFTVLVQAPIDFAKIGLTSVDVSLDYGDPQGDPTHLKHQDYAFDANNHQDQRWQVFMDNRLDTTYKYRIEYHFDPTSPWKARKYEYAYPTKTTEDRTLLVNPWDDLSFLEVRVFPNRLDADVISSTDVHLSYVSPSGWKRADVLTVIPGNKDPLYWRLRLEDKDAGAYSYFLVHHLKDGQNIQTDPAVTTATSIPVDDPFAGGLDLTCVPLMDPTQIRSAFFDFLYEDPGSNYRREFRQDFDGAATASWSKHVSIRDAKKISFKYRLTFEGKNGQEQRGPYVETQDTLIAIRPGGK